MGAPILVDASENTNPIDIALKELDARNTSNNYSEEHCQTEHSKIFH